MKPRIALLILLGSLVGLLLLIRATPATPAVMPTVAVTVTPAPTIVVPSRTPLPSPTAPQAPPTATETLADTATATQLPSATLPLIKGSVTDYELTVPPADALLDLYVEAQRQSQEAHSFPGKENPDFLQVDAYGFTNALLFGGHHYYPAGLPEVSRLLNSDWSFDYFYSSPNLIWFQDAVFDYLNKHALVSNGNNFSAEIYQVELDGDPGHEWLVRASSNQIAVATWLTLDEISKGKFRLLNSDLSSELIGIHGVSQNAIDVEDLTGDNRTDLVIASSNYSTGISFGFVEVLRGTADGFRKILYAPIGSYYALEDETVYEIVHPASSQPYLHLVRDTNLNWGCDWKTNETYSWPNGIERHMVDGRDPPNTPQCAVAKAVSTLVEPPDNATAIRLLETAARAFATKPADQPDYELFVHYRLAVLYALQGQQAAARQHLLWLRIYAATTLAHAPDAEYVNFVKDSVETELADAQVQPMRLCDAMASHAYLLAQRLVYLTESSAAHAYPLSSEPYPPAFCPVDDVLAQALPKSLLPTNTSLEVAFSQVGLKLAYAQPLPLAKGVEAWTVILQLNAPRLVTLVNGQVSPVEHTFSHTVGNLVTLDEDLTGDGLTDRAFAYRLDASYYCQSDNDPYDIVVVVPQVGNGLKTLANVECAPAVQFLNLHSLLADKDGNGVSDWVQTQLDKPQGQGYIAVRNPAWLAFDTELALKPNENELDGLRQVDDTFYKTPNSSQTRVRLQKALAAVPTDDPNAPRIRQHLSYLIAMTYELEGKNELALQTYYDIWADPTPTLWGNLAAIHLVHK